MKITEFESNKIKTEFADKVVCIVEKGNLFDPFLSNIKDMLGISSEQSYYECNNRLKLIKDNAEFCIIKKGETVLDKEKCSISHKREKRVICPKEHIDRLFLLIFDIFVPEGLKGITVFENEFFDIYRNNNCSLADRFFCEIQEGLIYCGHIGKFFVDDNLRAKMTDFAKRFAKNTESLNAVVSESESGFFYFENERYSSDFINVYTFILYRAMAEGILGIVGQEYYPVFLDLKGIKFSDSEIDMLFAKIKKLNGQVFLILDSDDKYISDKCDKTINV